MEDILGLLILAVYIVGIVGAAAAVTWAVIKIFPTQRNPKGPDDEGDDSSSSKRGTESQAGSLFRRSKKAAS